MASLAGGGVSEGEPGPESADRSGRWRNLWWRARSLLRWGRRITETPVHFAHDAEILERELRHICRLHQIRALHGEEAISPELTVTDYPETRTIPSPPLKSTDENERRQQLSGLALSGGGIRSAAFACGVMQALAERKRLQSFDYLSSVSGGGYAASALTWAIHQNRLASANVFPRFRVAEHQEDELLIRKGGFRGRLRPARYIMLLDHIRRRANYLAPNDDVSMMSGLLNTLRMSLASLAIYAVLAIAALTVATHAYLKAASGICSESTINWFRDILQRPSGLLANTAGEVLLNLVTGLVAWTTDLVAPFDERCVAGLSTFSAAAMVLLFFLFCVYYILRYALQPSFEASYRSRLIVLQRFTTTSRVLLFGFIAFLLPTLHSYRLELSENPQVYLTTLGSMLSSGTALLLSQLRQIGERNRALLLRLAAFFLFFVLMQVAFSAALEIAQRLPQSLLAEAVPRGLPVTLGTAILLSVVASAIGLSGPLLRFTPEGQQRVNEIVGALAIFGGLAWIAAVVFAVEVVFGHERILFVRLLGCSVAIYAICWLLNPNTISPHHFYRDRLMEAFMPAKRADNYRLSDNAQLCHMFDGERARIAGHVARLLNRGQAGIRTSDRAHRSATFYRAPYHLINTNVILVRSEQPKYYQRGGDSFILSPLFCGSTATGWIETRQHSRRFFGRGASLTLATAMAISGAAANPNTADGEDDATTRRWSISFLMTLFNIRLGYWQPNPGLAKPSSGTTRPPNFVMPGLASLVRDYFDERRSYVELSDGGHFDNTGLYELFRRRVRDIVLSDASADPDYSLDDLARALALAHVDFGVEVEFSGLDAADSQRIWEQLDRAPEQPNTYRGKGYPSMSDGVRAKVLRDGFAVATLRYPPAGRADALEGRLVYVKPALVKNAPIEILSYALNHPDFPHQSTSDQFFSERRFESYRQLGHVIGLRMCETVLA